MHGCSALHAAAVQPWQSRLLLLIRAWVQASAEEVLSNLQPLLNELPSTNPVAQEVVSIANIVADQRLTISSSTLTDVLSRLILRVRCLGHELMLA